MRGSFIALMARNVLRCTESFLVVTDKGMESDSDSGEYGAGLRGHHTVIYYHRGTTMKSMQKGFTLIELMIVVAIIAILAAIAIPAYQDYLVRSQVSEGATLTDGAKTAVAEYYSNHGDFPPSNASAGLPSTVKSISGKYVTQVDVGTDKAGVIEATFGNQASANIATKVFALSAVNQGGSINWTCNSNNGKTTVLDKYLPSSCRK